MSSPSRDQPTRVLPSTAERPAPTTATPPPARFWRQRVPGRIGRARTSTVVLGVLFVACFALYLLVRPAVEYTTVETTSGQTVRVPVSELAPTTGPADPVPEEPAGTAPAPAPTTSAPVDTTAPPTTSPAAPTEPEDEETTTTPTTSRAPATTRAPASTRAPETTSEAPAETAPTEGTTGPTG